MSLLKLALESRIPFIRVLSDDLVNIQRVLNHVAGLTSDPDNPEGNKEATGINIPAEIPKIEAFKLPTGDNISDVFYTSSETKSKTALYRFAMDHEVTIVFVNVEPDPIYFDGGALIPPQDLVIEFLEEMGLENASEVAQAFGGVTLKDVAEIARMTMTRDNQVTVKGINETRQGYKTLQGIVQVDTGQSYYVCPPDLKKWMGDNQSFFMNEVHASLTPRGLLFDGPPGTGKTESSKYIAATFGIPLYRMDLGAMMGKYVGTSENNLNAALAQIDEVQPCVVILDEVEKVFHAGGGDSGVSSRMLSQLLWWLQEHKSKVFTVMTTNDMKAIPPELFRPGRIDATMQFLGLPNVQAAQPFAKGAMTKLLTDMGVTLPDSAFKALEVNVKALFNDGQAVPQTKVVQSVNALIREAMVAQQKGEELAVSEPLLAAQPKAALLSKTAKAPALGTKTVV